MSGIGKANCLSSTLEQDLALGCSSAGCNEFLFSPSGSILAVVQNGALLKGTLPLPGGDTAIYNAGGLNYLRHTDSLNSSRLATTWGHAVYSKVAYAPFGETYNEAGTPDRSFTGQDQDVVSGSAGSGVYDFLFRKYDPSAGRWLSPDPSGWGAVSLSAPQSLNRYAYVQNNPMQAVDPTGLDCLYLNSNGSVTVGANYDCPTDGNGNPTDNGYFIDATNVSGGTFDSNGNLTAIFSGASVDVNAYGNMGPTLLGVSAGGAVAPSNSQGTCLRNALSDGRGAALALDVVGDVALAVAISNPASLTALAVGQAASVLATANSIQHTDWAGSGVGLANQTVGATGIVTHGLEVGGFIRQGTSFVKGLGRLGIVGAVASTVLDVSSAIAAYSTCRSTP